MKNRWASLLSQSMKRPFWRRQTAVAQKAVRLFPSRKRQVQREAFHEASRFLNERIAVAGLRAHDGSQYACGLPVPDHVLADRAYDADDLRRVIPGGDRCREATGVPPAGGSVQSAWLEPFTRPGLPQPPVCV